MLNKSLTKRELDNSIGKLREISSIVGLQYLHTSNTRREFFSDINNFIVNVTHEVDINCLSLAGAVEKIEKEAHSLEKQQFQLLTERAVQYAAVKKEIKDRRVKLFVNQVGFIGGGSQIFAGGGICAASLGTLCAAFGAPLMAHGANNIYEGGHYLLYRKSNTGYTRDAYRYIAKKLGYSANKADVAYGAVDIVLSGYGLMRNVPKQDTFSLYRYVNTDFIRGWQEMGRIPLFAEGVSDANTVYGIYQLSGE